MITGKNKPEILTKDMWCECKCKFDWRNVIQIKSGIMVNVKASVKNIIYVKKIIFGILPYSCKNGKHLAYVIDDNSVITCDEIIKETQKLFQKILMKKNQLIKHKISIFYLPFYQIL